MKTITLDEEAYERLKGLKTGRGESFSSVVKRVIPQRGNLGSFLDFTEAHQTQALPGNEIMGRIIDRNAPPSERASCSGR